MLLPPAVGAVLSPSFPGMVWSWQQPPSLDFSLVLFSFKLPHALLFVLKLCSSIFLLPLTQPKPLILQYPLFLENFLSFAFFFILVLLGFSWFLLCFFLNL